MHYLVRLIVQAEDKSEAISRAHQFADDLTGEGDKPFDWYDFSGRWGDTNETTTLATSEEGQALIAEGMKLQRADFDAAMKNIRFMLEHTDDEIYENEFKKEGRPEEAYYPDRYQFYKASEYTQGYVYVEGWSTGHIGNEKDLSGALEVGQGENPYWVVPVDMHS